MTQLEQLGRGLLEKVTSPFRKKREPLVQILGKEPVAKKTTKGNNLKILEREPVQTKGTRPLVELIKEAPTSTKGMVDVVSTEPLPPSQREIIIDLNPKGAMARAASLVAVITGSKPRLSGDFFRLNTPYMEDDAYTPLNHVLTAYVQLGQNPEASSSIINTNLSTLWFTIFNRQSTNSC